MVDYTLKRRRRMSSIRVRVEPSGEVMVTAPYGVPTSVIMSFLLKQSRWINRQQERIKLRREVNPVLDWERGVVMYLGQLYTLRFEPNMKTPRVRVGTSYIHVSPVTGLPTHVKRTFLRWLKQQAEVEITNRAKKWATKMGTRFAHIRFRQQKSRWGSCSSDNHLSFNWRLIHFKSEVIDYVVVHELAHTLHHNHSRRFWETVAEQDSTYKNKVKFLKTQVLTLV